ncbi:MAG: response regulator transcription factor [Clostridia bacterium]|nr:response regulator transcription factor [Clostridia bacterium]
MKILIVDDEAKIRAIIKKYAQFEDFETEEAADGMDAVRMCRENKYDLVIMDVMMPELDGFWAVREIRKTSPVPVIMLSARGEEYDRIHGFEMGIDDYVVKPFSPKELMLRIRAVISRSRPPEQDRPHRTLVHGGLVADLDARKVTLDGAALQLAPKEYELLVYLLENKNIALSREKILEKVWGFDYFGDDRTLDTHVKLLRKSLGRYSEDLVTVRGMGYRFETEH